MGAIDTDAGQHKNAIRRDIDRYRLAVARDCANLRQALDVPANLRAAIRSHSSAWIAGAGVLGFILSRLKRHPKPSRKRALESLPVKRTAWLAIAGAAIKWLLDLLRPALAEMIKKKMVDLSLRRR
jgi:hypothetical protein